MISQRERLRKLYRIRSVTRFSWVMPQFYGQTFIRRFDYANITCLARIVNQNLNLQESFFTRVNHCTNAGLTSAQDSNLDLGFYES